MSEGNHASYGGQAVIEGVMMRGPGHMVLSVRDPYGKVVSLTKVPQTLGKSTKLAKLPVIRGAIALGESLSLGIQMLMKSAEIASPEEEQPSESALSFAVFAALILGVSLFVVLPAYVAPRILGLLGLGGRFWTAFLESGFRIILLLLYVVSISRMEDIKRVLEYHGAEHKVIWAYEKNRQEVKEILGGCLKGETPVCQAKATEFLVKRALPEGVLHPRCGTSFLFIAVIITWIVFLFVSPPGFIARAAARVAMLPLIAGIAYEVLKASPGRKGLLWNLVKAPGMAMQRFTTKEPDEAQLEVAATSLVLLEIAERGLGELGR